MTTIRDCLSVPLIGFGHVRHARLRPCKHRFVYPTFFLMLPMRTMQKHPESAGVLAMNHFGLLSFRDADHGDKRGPTQGGALAWLDELLISEGITDAKGEAWLHCYPRVFGYSFKPVSFWHCHSSDGSLRAIVAEVNNTFGERHAYVLNHAVYGRELSVSKAFHVSPFCRVEGGYKFVFRRDGAADSQVLAVRLDYEDADGPLILTGINGRLEPLTERSRRRALVAYPLMTLAVIVRIHWHALRLWFKRVPFNAKPTRPSEPVTRSISPR